MTIEMINIILKANTQNAEAGLDKVTKGLQKAALSVKSLEDAAKSTDPLIRKIEQLQTPVQKFGGGAASLKASSFFDKIPAAANPAAAAIDKVSKSSGTAGFALTNLGRVAQDLPYGFIGIANNLNPLLESFQRLQKEAKATGQDVLPLLINELKGGAGLGLALSAVTAAITFAQIGFSMWSRGTKEATEKVSALNEELSKAQGSFATEVTKINALVAVAKDYSNTTDTRKNAIKELQKEYPGYLSNINLENINSQEAAKAIDSLSNALARKAKVQALSNLLTKASEDLYKAQSKSVEESGTVFDKFILKFAKGGVFRLGATAESAAAKQDAEMAAQITVDNLTDSLNKALKEQAVNNDFELINPTKAAKAKKEVETIASVYKDLQKQFAADNNNPLLNQFTRAQAKVEEIEAAITKMASLGANRETPIIKELTGELQRLKLFLTPDNIVVYLPSLDALGERLNKVLENKFPDGVPLTIVPNIKLEENDYTKALNESLVSGISDSIASAAEAIGEGKNPFEAVAQVIGETLKSFGKRIIEITVAMQIAKKALSLSFANPAAGIAAGAALIALGSLVEKLVPKFAAGGVVTRPTLALVGEAGPERITPLNAIENGRNGNLNGEVVFTISGNTLRGMLKRADNAANNIYGF